MSEHEAVYLNGRAINWNHPPDANHLVKWSKRTTSGKVIKGSFRTICHLNRLNNLALARYGTEMFIIQPPYNTSIAASAGTHDFDACFDWHIPGISWWEMQRFGRANGAGGWYRHPPTFSNHNHSFTLPPRRGSDVSDDYKAAGLKVGRYIDGGWSTAGDRVGSSQIEDYYSHAFGLSGEHTPGSDRSWFPDHISATIFDLDRYVATRAARQD